MEKCKKIKCPMKKINMKLNLNSRMRSVLQLKMKLAESAQHKFGQEISKLYKLNF